MARKKKKKTGGLFGLFSKKKKGRKSRKSTPGVSGLKIAAGIVILSILAAGGAVGLIQLEEYAQRNSTQDNTLPVTLYSFGEKPVWLQQEWYDCIYSAIGGEQFPPREGLARELQEKLSRIPWLYNTIVKITPDAIEILSDYRRPAALVQVKHNRKVYLDKDMVVLDYLPVTAVPVVEIKGLDSTKVPKPGETWLAEDAKAAVELLNWLYTMDQHSLANQQIKKPLLEEISDIDVSNFSGRRSRKPEKPHIVLTVKDGTVVRWGARWGDAAVHLEADEKEKLARLYQFYIDYNNSLQGMVKNIELRWLKDSIPRPR